MGIQFEPANLLTPSQAADLIGKHPNTLLIWRKSGKGPPSYRPTRSTVLYWLPEVVAWNTLHGEHRYVR